MDIHSTLAYNVHSFQDFSSRSSHWRFGLVNYTIVVFCFAIDFRMPPYILEASTSRKVVRARHHRLLPCSRQQSAFILRLEVFKLEKAFSTLSKKVPTFHCQSGPKTPKIGQVRVRSCTPNGTGKAETHLSLTLISYTKKSVLAEKKRTRMGSRTVLIRVAPLTQREKSENKNGLI